MVEVKGGLGDGMALMEILWLEAGVLLVCYMVDIGKLKLDDGTALGFHVFEGLCEVSRMEAIAEFPSLPNILSSCCDSFCAGRASFLPNCLFLC